MDPTVGSAAVGGFPRNGRERGRAGTGRPAHLFPVRNVVAGGGALGARGPCVPEIWSADERVAPSPQRRRGPAAAQLGELRRRARRGRVAAARPEREHTVGVGCGLRGVRGGRALPASGAD